MIEFNKKKYKEKNIFNRLTQKNTKMIKKIKFSSNQHLL